MPRLRLTCRWFAALLVLSTPLTGLTASLPGLLTAPAPEAAPAAAAATLAVAARDIPAQADADEKLARDVAAHARDRRSVDSLREQLDRVTTSVLQLASELRGDNLLEQPATKLLSLERRWLFYDRELTKWRRAQQTAVDAYADEAAQIESRRESWEATIAPENRDGGGAALIARVNQVLSVLKVSEQALAEPMSAQLAMGRRASSVQASIDAGLRAVRAAIANSDLRLWRIDSPPLWTLWREAATSPSALSAATAGVAVDRQFLAEYVAANRDRWVGHTVFALLLLPLLLWLSARSKRLLAADPEANVSGKALTRPVSSWCVLVLLSALFFEADGPVLLQETALLLAVIPVLRLLPEPVFKVLGAWPFAATALYVLQRMGFVLVGDPFWHRVHLLFITVLTLGLLVWLLLGKRDRAHAGLLGRVQRAATSLGCLAIALMCVAVVSNLIGNVSLAEVLTKGTVDSGYIFLALFAGTAVLNSIVRLLLVRRQASRFDAVTERAGPMLQALARLINVVAVIAWILAVLNSFRLLRPVLRTLHRVLTYEIGIGKVSLTLGGLLLFGAAVYVAFWIARWLRVILSDEVLPRMALPRGVANSVSTLSYYAVVLFGLMFALAASGVEMSQFAIVFGALGVGIGFGLQNIVNNFVSGLILMFERPIQPGDTVEITGTTGTVREIGMRATTLKTPEGADVVIPNGTLLSEKLINWTMSDMNRRVDVDLGVAYGTDPRKVAKLLTDVTADCTGIAAQPAPTVVFKGFGANSLIWKPAAASANMRPSSTTA